MSSTATYKHIYYRALATWLLIILLPNLHAQNIINEYSNFECSHSMLVPLPLIKSSLSPSLNKASALNKTVFYEHRDQFSYWYKIDANEGGVISCKISPINNNDSYSLYVYRYSKEDFCNKVFYGKIKPLKSSSFLNVKTQAESFELNEVTIKAKKKDAYYVCVLNTSPTNCGHNMQLISGNDTLNVKAIHFPCSDDDKDSLTAVANAIKASPVEASKEMVRTFKKVTLNVKEENNPKKLIDARLKIKDEMSGKEVKIESTAGSSYIMEIEKGKNYYVECLATGYREFIHSIAISEYVHPDSNTFTIYLRPLKSGENFIMNDIYFYPNTYALKRGSEKEIDYLLKYLSNNPDVKIELQGHTNGNNRIRKTKAYRSKGVEWNFEGSAKKLSRYRAESIKKYLISKGINELRIITQGYGGDRMVIEDPRTLEAIQKNVRVEVLIL